MKLRPMLKRSEGQILILTVLTIIVVLGLSALTIDLGMAYAVKAKLNSAVDAASLAAGKAVKIGADDASRRQNATNAANSFFAANFPTGIRGTTSSAFSVDSITSVDGSWIIRVSASATAPTFFSSIFNRPIRVGASAEATVKTLDMMLVLDCSGSLGSDFPDLQAAAVNFINGFQGGAGGDRIGLVTFASGAVLDDPINKNATRGFTKSTLVNHINATYSSGATNAEEAMRIAKAELDAIPAVLRSTLRAIVFFSDGAPNIVSARFKTSSGTIVPTCTTPPCGCGLYSVTDGGPRPTDCYPVNQRSGSRTAYVVPALQNLPILDYTGTVPLAGYARALTPAIPADRLFPWGNSWCNLNKASRDMLENLAHAARVAPGNAAITIYTIGLGARLRSNEVTNCGYGSFEYGENILKRLANTMDSDMYEAGQPSGIYVWAADATQLNSAFQRVRSAVLRLSQ